MLASAEVIHRGAFRATKYQDYRMLSKCSPAHAPWFIIPSNHKWFRNLAISQIVRDTLESLNMKFPEPTVDINEIKKKYHKIVEAKEAQANDKKNEKGK